MLHRLILKVTKFQLPTPTRFSSVVKNFLLGGGGGGGGENHAPSPYVKIGLMSAT